MDTSPSRLIIQPLLYPVPFRYKMRDEICTQVETKHVCLTGPIICNLLFSESDFSAIFETGSVYPLMGILTFENNPMSLAPSLVNMMFNTTSSLKCGETEVLSLAWKCCQMRCLEIFYLMIEGSLNSLEAAIVKGIWRCMHGPCQWGFSPFCSSFFTSLALKDWMTSPRAGYSIVVP